MIYTHRLTPALLDGFPPASRVAYTRGELTLCAHRDGSLRLLPHADAEAAATAGDMMPICRALAECDTPEQAFAPWRGVSVNVHADGVCYSLFEPAGRDTLCADLPRAVRPAVALRLMREAQADSGVEAVVVLRKWVDDPGVRYTPAWILEADEEEAA